MTEPEITSSPDSIVSRIAEAVNAGQTHPLSEPLREQICNILGAEKLPPVHGGLQKIIKSLYEENSCVAKRLLEAKDRQLQHTVLSAFFMQPAWREFERRHPNGPIRPGIAMQVYDEVNADSIHADNAFTKNLWNFHSYNTEAKTSLSPSEQFGSGIKGSLGAIGELLRVLPIVALDAEDASEGTWAKEDVVCIARRSIGPLSSAFASLPKAQHENIVLGAAVRQDKPLRKFQRPSEVQSPSFYRLVKNKAHYWVLTLRREIADLLPEVIVSYGCPAKFVQSVRGSNAVSAVSTLILDEWERSILPTLLPDNDVLRREHVQAHTNALQALHR